MCDCVLDKLRQKSFLELSCAEKLQIVRNGRPTPALDIRKMKKGKGYYSFQIHWYDKNSWLCGCQGTQKMYCWPCVLFSTGRTGLRAWNKNGVSDVTNFAISKKRHLSSKDHILCLSQLAKFGKIRITCLSEASKISLQQHNERVRSNRYVLSRLIDAVCYLSRQEQAFRGDDESQSSARKGNYMELLNVIGKTDSLLSSHLESSNDESVISVTSPDIQDDLISAVYQVLMNHIKREVEAASYVAVVVDATTDLRHKTQLATVLRYVTDQVQERFVGFGDCNEDRSAKGLFSHLEKTLEDFKCGQKLICHTYDGATVMAGCHFGVQKLVIDDYPTAIFVHCYAHKLNLVLQQAVSAIKSCKVFFQTCNGLSAFFSKSTSRSKAFDDILRRKCPTIAPTRWIYSSRLVAVISETKGVLMELFQEMSEGDSWDHETKIMALGYLHTFNQLEFQFLLSVFSIILPKAEILFNFLQNKFNDIRLCRRKIDNYLAEVQNIRDDFNSLWAGVNYYNEMRIDKETAFRALFYELLDIVMANLNERFGNLEDLGFLALLDPSMFPEHCKTFPTERFECLKSLYQGFDFIILKTELEVVYSDRDYRACKSLNEFHEFLLRGGLSKALPEVFKLATLILTIPATSASVEKSFSALKRIHTYARNNQTHERNCHLGVLSIEKRLLDQISQNPVFYDQVIDVFMKQKPRRIDLVYN